MKKQCASCGTFFPNKYEFCPVCGIKYTGESYELRKKIEQDSCPFCDTLRKRGNDFCTSCGYSFVLHDKILSVKEAKESSKQNYSKKNIFYKFFYSLINFIKNRKTIFPVIIILSYCLVIFFTYIVISSDLFPQVDFKILWVKSVHNSRENSDKIKSIDYSTNIYEHADKSDEYIDLVLDNVFNSFLSEEHKMNNNLDIDNYNIFADEYNNTGYQKLVAEYLHGLLISDYNLYLQPFPYFVKDSILAAYPNDNAKKEFIDKLHNWLLTEYGDDIKISARTTYEKQLSREELLFITYDLKTYCNYSKEFDISKAYNIIVEITYSGNKKQSTTYSNFTVIFHSGSPYLLFTRV